MVRLLAFLSLLSGLGLAAAVCRAQAEDADMKAAYIFNFAVFTTWPDGAARGPLIVCAQPDDPLWPGLQALNGKPVNGRPWTATALTEPQAAHCDIVVLARTAEQPAPLAAGVLVVRDGGGRGATISLVEDDEHIRFDIDTREAARCGLRLSARLLRLARNVL